MNWSVVPCSMVGPGLVSSTEAQVARWAQTPSPSKAQYYVRTLKGWVGECWTHSCARVLLIVFSCQDVYCIYVWRSSASVPAGSVSLQVSRCWGVRGREGGYWLSDLRPRLSPQPIGVQTYCAAWHMPPLAPQEWATRVGPDRSCSRT